MINFNQYQYININMINLFHSEMIFLMVLLDLMNNLPVRSIWLDQSDKNRLSD